MELYNKNESSNRKDREVDFGIKLMAWADLQMRDGKGNLESPVDLFDKFRSTTRARVYSDLVKYSFAESAMAPYPFSTGDGLSGNGKTGFGSTF